VVRAGAVGARSGSAARARARRRKGSRSGCRFSCAYGVSPALGIPPHGAELSAGTCPARPRGIPQKLGQAAHVISARELQCLPSQPCLPPSRCACSAAGGQTYRHMAVLRVHRGLPPCHRPRRPAASSPCRRSGRWCPGSSREGCRRRTEGRRSCFECSES